MRENEDQNGCEKVPSIGMNFLSENENGGQTWVRVEWRVLPCVCDAERVERGMKIGNHSLYKDYWS